MLVAGEDSFANIDVRVRVKGGGHTSQVYAIRQAIAKAVVAYFAKYVDAFSAIELKKKLVAYDRTLLIADPRRMEPKKFGGGGARARRQKRCVMLGFPRFFATEPDSHSVIGDGCLLLYVCVVKCHIFFHYQYVMTSCNNYAAMQLSVLPSQCLMSMFESRLFKVYHRGKYYSLLFAVSVYCSILLRLHGLSSYSSSLEMNSRLRL